MARYAKNLGIGKRRTRNIDAVIDRSVRGAPGKAPRKPQVVNQPVKTKRKQM